IFEKEVCRRARGAHTHFLAGEILDRVNLRRMLRRHDQREPRIPVIDNERLQVLALGGEIDAVVEISRNDIGATADHGFEGFRTTLKSTTSTLTPAFSDSPSACANIVGK